MKYFLFVIIALLSIQAYESKQITLNHSSPSRDLVEDFIKLIGEIRQNIITLISKGAAKISELLNDVIKMGKVKIEEAIVEMLKIQEAVKEEIKKLAEAAQEAGQNIEKCVLTSDTQISSLMITSIDNMDKCFDEPKQIAQKMHEGIKAVMDENAAIIDNLVEDFKQCDGLECRVNIITKGTEAMHEAYNRVQKIVEGALTDMSNELPNVLKCIRDERNKFEEEIIIIADNFKTCIGIGSTYQIKEIGVSSHFEEIYKEILESIYNTIKNGLGHMDVIMEEMIQKAEDIYKSALGEISKMVDEIQKEIEIVISEGKELGGGVRECIENQRERIANLVSSTQGNIETCLGSAKDIMKDMVAEAEKVINETIAEINKLAEDFKNCDKLTCRVETIKKLYSTVKQAQSNVAKLVEDTIKKIQDVVPEAAQCVKKEQENFQSEASKIIVDIRKCITDTNGASLFEALQKIIQKAQENARTVIADNIVKLQKEMEKLYDIVFETASNTKEEIKEISKEIFNELTKLKEEAKEMGEHVKLCVTLHEEEVEDLVRQSEKSIEECLRGLMDIFNEFYQDVEKAMVEGFDKIYSLVGEFDECSTTSCKTDVLKRGIQAVFEFNESVTDIVAKATNSMKEAIPATIKCISDQNNEFKLASKKIMDEIRGCINRDMY